MFSSANYLDLEKTEHGAAILPEEPVWTTLSRLGGYLEELLSAHSGERLEGEIHSSATIGENVVVAQGAVVEANAVIQGPAWIGSGTTIRSGAYLRQNVIVGRDSTLGNSCEFKNCLLFDHVEVPHFNYVGDSILGYRAHLGAGVICSNVRLDRRNVQVRDSSGGRIDTGLRKFGAIIGDYTEVGCNTVLSPGSILGRNCILYPVSHWQGVLPEKSIVKHKPELEIVPRT